MTHVVVGQGRRGAGSVAVGRGHPSVTVYVVVVGASVSVPMCHASVGAIGWDVPSERVSVHIDPEP